MLNLISYLVFWGLASRRLCLAAFNEPARADISLYSSNEHSDMDPDDEPWSSIEPSSELTYHSCYAEWECARLSLPLDWSRDASDRPRIAVAILKIPAKVSPTDPRYGGIIIVEPGGPGDSGVGKVFASGTRIQRIVDARPEPAAVDVSNLDERYFDIVGFDARGINHTTPRIECFPNTLARLVWALGEQTEGLIGSSNTALDAKWARYESLSKACMQRVGSKGHDSIALHMNTAPVARDIVEIAEQHERLLRGSRLGNLPLDGPGLQDHAAQKILGNSAQSAPPIRIWGTSYGTFVAATLASMYPEKIDKIVLDSNLVPDSIVSEEWRMNLQDTDKVFDVFSNLCSMVGPGKCAFYRSSGPIGIKQAFDDVHELLWQAPLAVPGTHDRGPDIVTWSDLKLMVERSLYSPIDKFPVMATILQDLSRRNGSSLADYKASKNMVTAADLQSEKYMASEACVKQGSYSSACQTLGERQIESDISIWCADGPDMSSIDRERFEAYWRSLRNQSALIGTSFAQLNLRCQGWSVRPKWRFDGPFGARTSHPPLIVNNHLDPVTPVQNAYAVASLFPESVVLEVNSVGHGVLQAPSHCVDAQIRKYFQTGELPQHGARCSADRHAFQDDTNAESLYDALLKTVE